MSFGADLVCRFQQRRGFRPLGRGTLSSATKYPKRRLEPAVLRTPLSPLECVLLSPARGRREDGLSRLGRYALLRRSTKVFHPNEQRLLRREWGRLPVCETDRIPHTARREPTVERNRQNVNPHYPTRVALSKAERAGTKRRSIRCSTGTGGTCEARKFRDAQQPPPSPRGS